MRNEKETVEFILKKTREIEEIIYSLNDEELEINIVMNVLGNMVLRYMIPPDIVMSAINRYQQMIDQRKAILN